ncbi:AsmA family protein [Sphingobium nicotianae]|uniref:AsmA family protein n=1 Tax=Sphingobium nicotianae TaxID=2782607 RepID=A0A9X1DFR1_9SPHN|nr:AsmA family protein [Sphingobium nicotianae]MBT2189008.1 AsmA family protein [Sphingobium nicotianae]
MDPKEFTSDARTEAEPLWEAGVDPRRRNRLRRAHRRWQRLPLPVRILAWALLILFTAWLILYITKGRFLKHPAERFATSLLSRDVKVEGDFQLYFAPFSLKFYAEGLTVANPDWAKQDGSFFKADVIDTRISTRRLIFGNRTIKALALKGGTVDLRWSREGDRNTWTFGDPNRKGKPLELPRIWRAIISGSQVHYEDPRLQLYTDVKIDTVLASDRAIDNAITFTGTGRMRASPFTMTGSLLTPNATVAGGENKFALHGRSATAYLDVTGTLDAPTQLEGARLDMAVYGTNLADLFDFLGVAVPDTRSYRFKSDVTYIDQAWKFARLRGVFGESDLNGNMTITMPNDRLLIEADLATQHLHMIDIAPFVGYNAQRIEAKGANGLVQQVQGTPRILPDAPLRVEAIKRFDAKVHYKVRDVMGQNLPISNIALALDLDKSLLKLSPLTFDMAGGHVWSDIAINARRMPVHTDYDIRLSPTPMGKLLGRWGVEESGTSGTINARVKMSGEGDTVRKSLATSNGRIAVILPKGSMWTRNVQLAELDIGVFIQKMFEKKLTEPVQINCGLIAFTVRDGIASADPILIDTQKNVMLGRGAFSFRDERLDLAVRADGKKFSLFSGQSPIGVNGFFAKPGINPISPELLARAGLSLGLGVAASPLAAIIAFIDVGDAKSAACGPVLAGAQATAQRTTKGKPRDDVGHGTPSKREDRR